MNLQARVTNILTKPASEWPVIAAEPADMVALYRDYIVILAAIPAVCLFLGFSIVGMPIVGRLGFAWALRAGLMQYVAALVGVLVAAVVVQLLAPTFGSTGETPQALKLVAYSYTPVWVAGVLNLLPPLAFLQLIAALFAIYIFYLGLPPVMKTPQDKVVPYMVVAAIAIILVSIVLNLVLSPIGGMGYGRMY